ncbi:MAG TPA: hypothetical protein VKG25_28970 [Bryobacteraceae bacterium]|nr:hypothetical protein [Bryobacteraceae bacterium]
MSSQTLFSLAPLALTAAGLSATLWFFIQFKTEIARLALSSPRRKKAEAETEPGEIKRLNTRLDELAARIEERGPLIFSNPMPGMLEPAGMLPPTGLNLNKRTHVLRLSRRGDAPDHIAATLRLPRREVELLLKIHELSLKRAPGREV